MSGHEHESGNSALNTGVSTFTDDLPHAVESGMVPVSESVTETGILWFFMLPIMLMDAYATGEGGHH